MKFIAHDSAGYAIGRDYSDTLCIDNEGNGPPYIELIDDYFLKNTSIFSDTYTMSILLADPESDSLHISFSISYDNGQFFTSFAENEAAEGIFKMEIALNQLYRSDVTVIRVDVSDGENLSSVSTLNFQNGNGTTVTMEEYPETSFDIFPNPACKLLNIRTDRPGRYLVEINSLNGQLLYTTGFNNSTNQTDLTTLQNGIYMITIKSEDFITTRKIIKF